MVDKINIFWFRRDLRLHDNPGLYQALQEGTPVLLLFIFDKNILDDLEDNHDPRITFLLDEITKIHTELIRKGSGILVQHGKPLEVFKELFRKYSIGAVYSNRDYEPYGIKRDLSVRDLSESLGIQFRQYQDHVIFEKDDILNNQGEPYKVFTPYKNRWLDLFHNARTNAYNSEALLGKLNFKPPDRIPALAELGFRRSSIRIPSRKIDLGIIKQYERNRDYPSKNGTSKIGIHLRHGTVSIRKAVKTAVIHNKTWLNELIWREFYSMILYHYPAIVNQSFKSRYDRIGWINDEEHFERWCSGATGYPIVDAGLRQLNEAGFMHNRVRMITASFLTKHLLIDWRHGEAYFGKKLLDYELASNNGGWQWAAGTGTDAQPYFRVFNPYEQTRKFDPNKEYIKRWIPELETADYPKPVIEHKFARQRAIETYKKALE